MSGMIPAPLSESELNFWDYLALHGTLLFSDRKPSREELLKAVKLLVQDSKYRRQIIAEQTKELNDLDQVIERIFTEQKSREAQA